MISKVWKRSYKVICVLVLLVIVYGFLFYYVTVFSWHYDFSKKLACENNSSKLTSCTNVNEIKDSSSKQIVLYRPSGMIRASAVGSRTEKMSYLLGRHLSSKNRNNMLILGQNNSSKGVVNSVSHKIKIGILIPSTTRKIRNPYLKNLSLTTICLPSIYRTIQENFEYRIYVGTNRGDYLESVKQHLEDVFSLSKVIVTNVYTFTKTVNAIARQAYHDGMDYIVRINDDTSFLPSNWTSDALSVLQSYTPPNIGVVGPTCNEGNTNILTHDMVHRTHLEIFDYYYPPCFDNKWSDDWITRVYQPDRSTKLMNWIVKHHISAHGTRYNVDIKQWYRLNTTLKFDRERVAKYISKSTYS